MKKNKNSWEQRCRRNYKHRLCGAYPAFWRAVRTLVDGVPGNDPTSHIWHQRELVAWQMEVHFRPKGGWTFRKATRFLLRQDGPMFIPMSKVANLLEGYTMTGSVTGDFQSLFQAFSPAEDYIYEPRVVEEEEEPADISNKDALKEVCPKFYEWWQSSDGSADQLRHKGFSLLTPFGKGVMNFRAGVHGSLLLSVVENLNNANMRLTHDWLVFYRGWHVAAASEFLKWVQDQLDPPNRLLLGRRDPRPTQEVIEIAEQANRAFFELTGKKL